MPRSGQWRSELALADMNGDGLMDLVVPAARKGAGRPQIFLGQPDGKWTAWKEATFASGRFDYGGVAAANFDGSPLPGVVFGMHLKGLNALAQKSAGQFHESSAGLNRLASGANSSTGSQSLAALPTAGARQRQQLLVVYEAIGNSGVGASLWRYDGTEWHRRDLSGAPSGSHAIALDDGRAFYMGGGGIIAVDTTAVTPSASEVGRVPDGTVPHAMTIVAGRPNEAPAAYLATSRFLDGEWHRRVERISALGTSGSSSPEPDAVIVERTGPRYFSAVAATDGKPWDVTGTIVAVGDEQGEIRIFRVGRAGRSVEIAHLTPPAWRTGCGAAFLQWAKLGASGAPRLFAMFSGEPSVYDLNRSCPSGGALDVFEVTARR